MPRGESSSGLPAVLGAPSGDLLQERDRKEVPQPIDARIIGGVAVLLVELAEAPVAVAAELIEPAFVTRVVDGGGDARSALGREEDVVVCRVLRRKLHSLSADPIRIGV
jgi:hypothetical protein